MEQVLASVLKVKVAIKRRLSSSYWTADHYTCDVRNDLVVIFEVTFIRPVNKNDVVLRSKIAVYCIAKINNNSFVALQTCIFYSEVDKGHWSLAIHDAPLNYSTCNKSND